jgi:predicted metal-dependent HD superfamily phosphohydrolase
MVTAKASWPMLSKVRDAWDQLSGKYCNDTALTDRFFAEIEKKYTTSRRHYHNLQHIAALLQLCETYAVQLHDRDVVEFSIFYHDIIYNVLRKDNEPRSAAVAVKRLQALQVPAEKTAQVKIYIEATQTHVVTAAVTHISDLQLFLDFDMAVLGADPEEYDAYTQQVRREYRIYPDKLYYPGRRQFLQHCLQKPFIFQTTVFRDKYEARARENMAREQLAIDTGPGFSTFRRRP